jgi:hypothetical protein
MKTANKLVTVKVIADEYERPISTIRRWARQRIIPCVQVGWRTKLFDPEAVRRALMKKTVREL